MAPSSGRPQDPYVEARVLATTATLLADRGYDALRIDDVVRATGVAKTTIYRRWPSLQHLAVSAAVQAVGDRTIEPTGDLRTDLVALVRAAFPPVIGTGLIVRIGLDIARQPDDDLRALYRRHLIDPVREQAIALVTSAVRTGHVDPSIDPAVVVDAAIGGLVYRVAILHDKVSLEQAEQFAAEVVRWIQPRP